MAEPFEVVLAASNKGLTITETDFHNLMKSALAEEKYAFCELLTNQCQPYRYDNDDEYDPNDPPDFKHLLVRPFKDLRSHPRFVSFFKEVCIDEPRRMWKKYHRIDPSFSYPSDRYHHTTGVIYQVRWPYEQWEIQESGVRQQVISRDGSYWEYESIESIKYTGNMITLFKPEGEE